MEGAVAIADRMRYGVKPSAVRSESYLHNIKASNGSNFNCTLGQDIIFDVPALGNGYYCDFSTSYIRFRVDVTLANKLTQVDGSTVDAANGYVRFKRGPESMFRRVLIQDASGNLLETMENYNDLYCLTELLTNNKMNRSGPGVYHGEGLVLPGGVTPTVSVTLPSGVYTNSATCPTTVNYSPLAAGNQVNGKYKPRCYPSLVELLLLIMLWEAPEM